MRANGGGSIIPSSTAGSIGVEGMTAYCASKTPTSRLPAVPRGIRAGQHPGQRGESGNDRHDEQSDASPLSMPASSSRGALARIGRVNEVAALIAFWPSDDATFITGDNTSSMVVCLRGNDVLTIGHAGSGYG
jgi:3alpha(or 20beta)-hydroxysteroid dehydrogenase